MMKRKKEAYTSTKRDQYTVVLEGIRSDNKIFGENLQFVRDSVASLDTKVDLRFTKVDEQLEFFKTELALIRHRLVNPEEIHLLELRIAALEKKIK